MNHRFSQSGSSQDWPLSTAVGHRQTVAPQADASSRLISSLGLPADSAARAPMHSYRPRILCLDPARPRPSVRAPTSTATFSASHVVVTRLSHQQLFQQTAQTIAHHDLLLVNLTATPLADAFALIDWLRLVTHAPLVVLGEFTCAHTRADLLYIGADAILNVDVQPGVLAAYCRALLNRWLAGDLNPD